MTAQELAPDFPPHSHIRRAALKVHEKMLQCAAEGRIDDDHLAPPQAQDLPDNGADVVHIHLLYDAPRLDLSFKSIAQSIKFFSRFGDQQWQLRQKCQLVSSTHLLTPVNYSRPGQWVGEANVLLHATNHSRDSIDLRSEPRRMQPSSSLHSTPRLRSLETYLSRSQAKGATRWRSRCRIG